MQSTIQGLRRSASFKALVIGGLILVLLIPVSMIKGVVHSRNTVHEQARYEIMRSWGNEQLVAGPILIVPYNWTHTKSNGEQYTAEGRIHLLPTDLNFTTDVNPEIRERGLHKVPIYSASIDIRGTFRTPDIALLDVRNPRLEWDKASIVLTVSDARAIAETPSIDIDGKTSTFEPGGDKLFADMPPPIVASAAQSNAIAGAERALEFSMTLHVNGSDTLLLMPLGDTTRVSMTSTWASPSFLGNYLPATREIGDDGFVANWKVASLGRELPSQWTDRSAQHTNARNSAFGVNFFVPISLYRLSLRATTYAVLFIGLTFVAYFLFEIMAKLRLHPLQYLLVGFSNAMFYLLLLSLAEHIGFGWAYAVSALASAGLITGYSRTVLNGRTRAFLMAIVLIGLYGFLYMTLKAENFALLAGALGLWVTLATIMFLTRRIDWYATQQRDSAAP